MESKEIISNYKKKVEALSVEKLKYEAQLKVLNESLNESMQELKNFGYNSLAEAEESLQELLKSLEQKTEEIDKALDIVAKLDAKDIPVDEKQEAGPIESFDSIQPEKLNAVIDKPLESVKEIKTEAESTKPQSIFDLI